MGLVCTSKWANPGLVFVYFRSFQTQNFTEKTVGFSGIRTRIVGVEGQHSDHLTTTTALQDRTYSFDVPRVVTDGPEDVGVRVQGENVPFVAGVTADKLN